jgi:pimeloyl-ACP methyl ester carboxylesterase
MAALLGEETTVELDGVALQVFQGGSGPLLLVLHDYEYLHAWHPFLAALAAEYRVLAPSHPGFGRSSLPPTFDAIDDLAYFYLDLLRAQPDTPAHVLGLGFGGWIAAEMAIRCSHPIARLVLVAAVGIKVSGPTTRDIVDHFVIGPEEYLRLSWHDPALGAQRHKLAGLGELTDDELVTLLRNRQSTALYGWRPFLHNPKLRAWLRRVAVPTLVLWGESDQIVSPAYGRVWAEEIPGARFVTLPAAGHYPYLEQPDAFVGAVRGFLAAGTPPAPVTAR